MSIRIKGGVEPPEDTLKDIFTPEVMSKLRRNATCSSPTMWRLNVLEASGPYPTNKFYASLVANLRAYKAAWDSYLTAAYAIGMFQGSEGNMLRGDLTSKNDNGFRGALANCAACWFLACRMHFPVSLHPLCRAGKMLDMRIAFPDGDVGVEVKAPYREMPRSASGEYLPWNGDDSDKIRQCLESANRQFTDECANVLLIMPNLRTTVCTYPHDLIKAAFGSSTIARLIDTKTGGPAGPVENKFFPEGHFLNVKKPNGELMKPDGFPAYRRISAVLCIEEKLVCKYPHPNLLDLREDNCHELWPYYNETWIEHDAIVAHNPFAYHPISQDIFQGFPQFLPIGDEMAWTDGSEIDV